MFVAAVDAARVREGALKNNAPDGEHVYVHRVSVDAARSMRSIVTPCRGSPLIIGLQWLALNRQRVPQLLG